MDKPVAWMYEFGTDNADAVNEVRWYRNVHLTKPTGMVRNVVPLYTASPKKEWVGLTDEEVKEIYIDTEIKVDEHWRNGGTTMMFPITLYKAIEAKLKEKNNG